MYARVHGLYTARREAAVPGILPQRNFPAIKSKSQECRHAHELLSLPDPAAHCEKPPTTGMIVDVV